MCWVCRHACQGGDPAPFDELHLVHMKLSAHQILASRNVSFKLLLAMLTNSCGKGLSSVSSDVSKQGSSLLENAKILLWQS